MLNSNTDLINLANANKTSLENSLNLVSLKLLLKFNFHIGHRVNRLNPLMSSYILGIRNGIHIIDLEKTIVLLKKSLSFIKEVASRRGRILFIGTSSNTKITDLIQTTAEGCDQFFINKKWIGGTLTNYKEIVSVVNNLHTEDVSPKKLKRYKKLMGYYESIYAMNNLPDLIVITKLESKEDRKTILKEANMLNIPVVSLVDTDQDPTKITYPVVGNDDSYRAIWLFCKLIGAAVQEGYDLEKLRVIKGYN